MSCLPEFQIEYDRFRREWILHAHPELNHAPLRFPEMARGGGALGLFGALSLCMHHGRHRGGRIRIHFHGESLELWFEPEARPELATMERGEPATMERGEPAG